MFKIVFTVALCVVFFNQSLTATEIKSSKDDAKRAFHHLMDAIDKTLTEVQNSLNKAMNEVKAKATDLEGRVKVELDKTLRPLREKLNKLIAEAKAKGFNVAKCQSYVDHFSNTPDDLLQNLVNCLNQQISKAQNYVNDALNNAKKIEQDLNTIDQDIDKCNGNKWKQIKCFAKIIEKIAKDTKEAPQHIVEDVAKTTALISDIVPILEQCFTNQLKHAGESAVKDVADFGVCVAIPF